MTRPAPRRRLGRTRAVAIAALAAVTWSTLPAPALEAQSAPTISGAGSTWSQPAIDQWRNEVARQGLNVNYQGVGSSAGRSFYASESVDFAVSEIPFYADEREQLGDRRPFVYLPIVAGGTSLMYNLTDAGGATVTNLQLSPKTLTAVFTGSIRDWADPAITADNNGRVLPAGPITPVIRSDGSGTSAQFTEFMAKIVPELWAPFMRERGLPPESTSFYPEIRNVSKAQSGSDGVANYVNANRGSIGYVERAFALQRGRPTASIRNAAGQYTQPTADNVAIALTRARLRSDRTQILDDVYVNPDPRTYPISSYSYMIAPTTGFDPAKGEVLARFIHYFACAGQRRADVLGYSPLPPNLVQTAFEAANEIPGAGQAPAINASECKNPTVTGERTSIGTSTGSAAPSAAPTAPGIAAAPSGGGATPTGGAAATGGGAAVAGAPGAAAPGSGGGLTEAVGADGAPLAAALGADGDGGAVASAVDPATGAVTGSAGGVATVARLSLTTEELGSLTSDPSPVAPSVVAALLLLLLVFVPPLAGRRLRRRGVIADAGVASAERPLPLLAEATSPRRRLLRLPGRR